MVGKKYVMGAALWGFCILLVWSEKAFTDRVVLKDGTIIDSDRIWESDRYVHFILKGTGSVEIRYVKGIVDRIETGDPPQVVIVYKSPSRDGSLESPDQRENDDIDIEAESNNSNSKKTSAKGASIESNELSKLNSGILFYDPRRKKRYWAGQNAHFNRLDEAINALSQKYQRTPDWIEKYMGEMNDLGVIHNNLNQQITVESQTPMEHTDSENDDTKHQGLESGSHTVAASQNRQDIAEQTTPKDQIKDNVPSLSNENLEKNEGIDKQMIKKSIPDTDLKLFEGLVFYDPRRPQKYWVTPTDRHATLGGAIEALATYYNVSTRWVEEYMGNTNDLKQLHINLIKGLQK